MTSSSLNLVAVRTGGYEQILSNSIKMNGVISSTCSGEFTISRRSSFAGPFDLAPARTKMLVSGTTLI
jgi:hypothetical protein